MGKEAGRSKLVELILFLLVSFGSVVASESFSRPFPKLAPLSLASFHPRLSRLQDHTSLVQFTALCKVNDSGQATCEWHSTGMFKYAWMGTRLRFKNLMRT